MKKLNVIFTVLILFFSISFDVNASREKDNYLLLRNETGKNTKTDNKFHGTYNVFENNSLRSWAFGSQFITGENSFMLMIPHICYKLGKGYQLGARYSFDSLDNEFIGLAFRFIRPINIIFVFFDATQYFDVKDNKDKIDIYLSLKTLEHGWYYGMEFWYYNIKHCTENLHFRPIKVGYRFKNNLAPFIMLQRRWNDKGFIADSILTGVEVKF